MSFSTKRVARRFALKLALGLFVVALWLSAGGLWLFLRDQTDFAAAQQQTLTGLNINRQHLATSLDDVARRRAEVQAELAKQQAREKMENRTIADLNELRSRWDSWFGDRERQGVYAGRFVRAEQLKEDTTAREVELKQELVRTQWEKDGLEIDRDQLDNRIHETEANQSPVMHYGRLAWGKMKWYVAAMLGLYFFWPLLGKRLAKLAVKFRRRDITSRGGRP